MLIARVIDIYSLIIVAAVIASWINVSPQQPAIRLLRSLTEPVLEPVRRLLPPAAGVDFSPLVVLVVLRLAARMF